MSVHTDTIAAVDDHWRTARVIHDRVNVWALNSIKGALTNMTELGLIEMQKAKGNVNEYRMARKPE